MGRPPSNGGPAFRFNPSEVAEMEAILQAHNAQVPSREILVSLAEKFSNSTDRSGKVAVQMKQVWNWFQNRRYALRAKAAKTPVKLTASPAVTNDLAAVRNVPQAPQHIPVTPVSAIIRNVPQVPQTISSASGQGAGQNGSDNFLMEFEAKSARDGAWYDVATFISHRSVETADPEVLVRFAGLGPEEDEWVNVRKHVRQRSLPCEATECIVVNPSDLILCFQEGKEQALYFDAHVLDAQRRRHDVRGCRCRFLVRYDHDLSEEIVPLKKVCRRPETDYRLRQLHVESATMNQSKTVLVPNTGSIVVYPSSEATQKQQKAEAPAETKDQPPKADTLSNNQPVQAPVTQTDASATKASVPDVVAGVSPAVVAPVTQTNSFTTKASVADAVAGVNAPAFAPALTAQPATPVATPTNPIALSNVSGATLSPATTTNSAVQCIDSGATVSKVTSAVTIADSITSGATVFAASTTNPADQFIDSGTVACSVTTTSSVTPLVTPGAIASTFRDASVSSSAASAVPTGTPVANSMATITPVANPTVAGQVSSTTTPVANSTVTGAVTTAIPVANSTAAAAADSLVTTTTLVPNPNLAGVTDSIVTTASTANSDVTGVAESEGIATTPVAESAVSDVSNSVASEVV